MEDSHKIQTGGEKKASKSIIKRILKGIAWFAGIWLAVLIILQLALSPKVIGGIVDKFAGEYIDGTLKFGKIKVDMFRHFPRMGLIMEDVSLTYPAERFDRLEEQGAQGRLLYHGCGEMEDTLASFKHFSASINIASLVTGKVDIPHILLVGPRIFAHSYDERNANWNIFKLTESEEDTTSTQTALPPLAFGRIRMVDKPHIVYTDSRDTIFAAIGVKRIAFDGRLDTRRTSKTKIGLTVDSMMVGGRMAGDTLGFRLDRLNIHEHNNHVDILAEAKAHLLTRTFGRMHIPINISGTAELPKDTVPVIEMHDFKAEIASIPLAFDLTARMGEKINVKGEFNIDGCRIEDVIDDFAKNIVPAADDIKTDASIHFSGTCEGNIGGGELPDIDVLLIIPEARVGYKDFDYEARMALEAVAWTDNRGKINVNIDKALVNTCGLDLTAKAGASDVLGDDPLISVDGSLIAVADSLVTWLPEDSGIEASGSLLAEVKGNIKMSQMNMYSFGNAGIEAWINSEELVVRSPADTIDINIKGLEIKAGPETKVSRRNKDLAFRLLAVSCDIAKTEISFKNTIKVRGEQLNLAAKNSIDEAADTSRIHPLGGHFSAKRLFVRDQSGMALGMQDTWNGFLMMPKRGNPEIPVMSVTSRNERIFVRDQDNRLILKKANVRATAAMNTVERRQKRRAFMDSLALAHPEIPRDSLFSYLRSQRKAREIPEWMKEEDFRAKDINFSLNETMAKYFREWDLKGNLNVDSGILMTKFFPLKNTLDDMEISFNNNEINIDSLRVISGSSNLEIIGSVSGLRRALLGRGTYKVDLGILSEKVNANELLAAFNAGMEAEKAVSSDAVEETSDEEFLEMVVADSLEATGLNSLLVVPANINAEIILDAKNISFSDLQIDRMTADLVLKERCMQITNTTAATNMGAISFEGFYTTRTKKDIKTGFNLNIKDVTADKVIAMMPAIDTLMPLVKSFKGNLGCEVAATADLDTCMNLVMPSINGVVRISGEDLTLNDNTLLTSLAKKLRFKNRQNPKINKMMVEGLIKDNTFEVFPFVLKLDRYTLAMSGIQNMDMSFRYHVSVIKSPILFKIGVDLYGTDFDHLKFRIGKPKYKSSKVPVFSTVIDQTKINLAESIKHIFDRSVEMAVKENEINKAIEEHKEDIGYVNMADQQMEELTTEEQKEYESQMDRLEQSEAAPIDSLSISKTLNEIISK